MIEQDRHFKTLASLLAGHTAESCPDWADIDVTDFVASCGSNGVTALVHDLLSKQQHLHAPEALLSALRGASTHAVVFESQHARLLGEVGKKLAAEGIQPLVFKGSALAYQFYDPPFTRERCDTDMLFKSKDVALAAAALLCKDLGFKSYTTAEGSLISYEKAIFKTDAIGIHHELDIHWKISNNNIYGNTFSYDELYRRGISVDIGGHRFQTPSAVDALIITFLHRMANIAEGKEKRLIWLYDMKLISDTLTPRDWQSMVDRARMKRIAHTCLMSLDSVEQAFQKSINAGVKAHLAEATCHEDIPTLFLESHSTGLIGNLLALPSWRLRFLSAIQVMFPSMAYMRHKYGFRHAAAAPYYYLVRIVSGTLNSVRSRR